jgi:7-cyano-7-deazaguanine synthase in queuosine biosynthesis
MSRHTLHLSLPAKALARFGTTNFLWRPVGEPSSFHTTVSPRAEELGVVPDANVELLRMATLAYLVDRTVPRPRRWTRELELVVPVFDPDRWRPVDDQVADTLEFLTGDAWEVTFRAKRGAARRRVEREAAQAERVSLFSGGADSLCGLLISLEQGMIPHLVSHWDWTIISAAQNRVLNTLARELNVEPTRDVVRIGRKSSQLGSNAAFPTEDTSRSRSIIFMALGLAAAAVRGAELWVPENGFASLNLPLAPERRGALSTRTTHPRLLDELQSIARAVGINVTIENPFESMTKGEILRRVADAYGDDMAVTVLSSSHSCARSGANYSGFDPSTHCGVCFGCLVRRAAFVGAGLDDQTIYIEEELRADGSRRRAWIRNRRQDVAAVEYRARRPYEMADVLAASLPGRVLPENALALAKRGADELAQLSIRP